MSLSFLCLLTNPNFPPHHTPSSSPFSTLRPRGMAGERPFTNMSPNTLKLVSLLLFSLVIPSYSKSESESETLLLFKGSLENTGALWNWNTSTSPCSGEKANWVGVVCVRSHVWGLQLENMGLSGYIDMETLKKLPLLRAISLMNNNFEGGYPPFKMLGALKSVYLSNNKFWGEIPGDAFDGMLSLKRVFLANNKFSGIIPLSLTLLPKLMELSLEQNQFTGQIPNFLPGRLILFNVTNNNLYGRIPASLSKMSANSFSGNEDLCGDPIEKCHSNKRLPITVLVIVVVSLVAALAAIILVIIIMRKRRMSQQALALAPVPPPHRRKASQSADLGIIEQGNFFESSTKSKKGDANGARLTFIKDEREQFQLSDLLRASAEVLGSGYFGSSYKAAMMSGEVVVVKRFRQMNNMGREEFEDHMTRIGKLSHPNLLPLVAFYYRKEEKLLVNDYIDNVSLAVHLHGNRNRGHQTLDWSTRLKIIRGVGKGLEHLYKELPGLIVAHGHLKSSNVLLSKSTYEPLLTDYGLVPLVDQEHAQQILVAYKSPEYKHHGRVTKKTDVWSFGILILEMLTGIFPANYLQQGKGNDTDLVTLVNSIIREERKDELFDKDLRGTENAEGEMTKLLTIALACAETEVEKRLDLKEAVEKIEGIKEKDIDNEELNSYTSKGNVRSSRGSSDDFNI